MVVYRHKIWLNKVKGRVDENRLKEGGKYVLLFLGLFSVLSIFGSQIITTINKGFETQRRTDLIAAEVEKLEKENDRLKQQKDIYLSESEIESQYRSLENKKKPGEEVYIVSLPEDPKNTASIEQSADLPAPTPEPERPNWEKWIVKIFGSEEV